jgi:Domain of unknown function (DUF4340)
MSTKRLQQIALGVVALLVLWGGSLLLRHRSDTLGGYTAPALSDSTVDRVTIAGAGDTVTLARQPSSNWTVNGWKASSSSVRELLADLSDTTGAELIAENPASWQRLGVDSAGGYRLRAVQGGHTLLDLVIGKGGSDYSSAYVRRPGDPHVYLVHSALHPLAARKIDDWRDRTVVQLRADTAAAIRVSIGSRTYALKRAGKKWQLANGAPADSSGVAQLLEGMNNLTAIGFATPAQRDSASFARPDRAVLVEDAHGDTLADLAMDSTNDGYWTRSARDSVVYKISAYVARQIAPPDSTVAGKGG